MSLSEMGFTPLHQLLGPFLHLRAHGAIWGLICFDVKGLGGWKAAGTGYPFPDLDQSVCESRVWGFLPLTAALWTVAKRMIELEKAREGSLCSMEESYPEEIEWNMCV